MNDANNNQQNYNGGFAFGNQGQTGGQAAGGAQPAHQQPAQPVPPVQPAAPAPAPQPAYAAPAAPAPAPAPAPQAAAPGAPAAPAAPAPAAPAAGMPPAQGGVLGGAQAGGQPGAARPGGAKPGAQQPPFDPNYRFGEKMKNFTTTVKLPAHSLNVDEDKFLNLLAGSISLTREEKKKIVDSIPKLRQAQVDELIRIFEEERAKFIELSPKHGAQLKKLEDEHHADWRDIELMYKQEAQGQEEAQEADDIRKQLGLQ